MCKRGMWMVAANESTVSAMVFRMRCKQWDCPDCAKINSDMWCNRVVFGAENIAQSGKRIVLVTVTAHERLSLNYAVDRLPDAWNKLRCRWRRECDERDYVLVPEIGKRGHFHIHLITTGKMGTQWWKNAARSSGFGWSSDEQDRDCSPAAAGTYVGKYLAKQLTVGQFKKGFHRVRVSRGWPKLPKLPQSPDWHFLPFASGLSVHAALQRLGAHGYSVALADERASWYFINTGKLTEGCQGLTLNSPTSIPIGG